MKRLPPPQIPTLAERAIDLSTLDLDGAQVQLCAGRELQFRFEITPSAFGRLYSCLLTVTPDAHSPEVIVLAPDLQVLAGDTVLPHVYPHNGQGTKLCLWRPRRRDWAPQLKLSETFVPWTAEWLWYFEDWLATGEWAGGGEHPTPRAQRWPHIGQPPGLSHA
jgi:hypothetical protein